MTPRSAHATAEVFFTAFEALPRPERTAVLRRLFDDRDLHDDLIDAAKWIERAKEPAVPYERLHRKLKKAGRV